MRAQESIGRAGGIRVIAFGYFRLLTRCATGYNKCKLRKKAQIGPAFPGLYALYPHVKGETYDHGQAAGAHGDHRDGRFRRVASRGDPDTGEGGGMPSDCDL